MASAHMCIPPTHTCIIKIKINLKKHCAIDMQVQYRLYPVKWFPNLKTCPQDVYHWVTKTSLITIINSFIIFDIAWKNNRSPLSQSYSPYIWFRNDHKEKLAVDVVAGSTNSVIAWRSLTVNSEGLSSPASKGQTTASFALHLKKRHHTFPVAHL